MSLTLYSNPSLIDFLQVLSRLPADEIEQIEAFSGAPFNVEKVAALYSLREGPKWVLCADNRPIAIAGFDMIRPGVWQDWMFSTPEAWTDHWRTVTKHVRRVMEVMLREDAHRLQCVSLASRTAAHKWYGVLKLEREGVLRDYGVNREDAIMFSRVRYPDGR